MEVTQISDKVYVFKDKAGCYADLIVGEEKALLFDTGLGVEDLPAAVNKITTLPLLVINSHGHFDHTGGNSQFDLVYLSSLDFDILESYSEENLKEWSREMVEDKDYDFPPIVYNTDNIKPIDFKEFNLGNLSCEIIPLPGHTKGSIGILIKELKLLLSGDALLPVASLHFYNHLTRTEQEKTLLKIQDLNFDHFLGAHDNRLFPKAFLNRLLACLKNSRSKKHYDYTYPYPPYTEGVIYVDSLEDEPTAIILSKEEYKEQLDS